MNAYVALLRGINVGGRNRVPMADLRALCAELGWTDVRNYIQSGNVVFRSDEPAPRLEAALEEGIERRFGLSIPVIVRAGADWPEHVRGNPFPEASRAQPNRVMLALAKDAPAADALDRLRERAADGERLERVGDALWILYAGGSGRSKLSPALLDRLAGSPVPTRNWRTVLALEEMLAPML
jgi:uncharacterized protein (DUF1697 family)